MICDDDDEDDSDLNQTENSLNNHHLSTKPLNYRHPQTQHLREF